MVVSMYLKPLTIVILNELVRLVVVVARSILHGLACVVVVVVVVVVECALLTTRDKGRVCTKCGHFWDLERVS